MKKTTSGFTIVELLIVIVVIGILAAITIVAYNGIQTRARNGQVIAGVNAYMKAVESYKALNGTYPTSNGCLGANYPSNQCWVGTNGNYGVNTTLDAALAEFVPTKPTLATSLLPIYTGVDSRGGLLYIYDSTTQSRIFYYLQGTGQNCSIGGIVGYSEGVLTVCTRTLTP